MKKIILLYSTLFFVANSFAQKIKYDVSFPNIAHHEANITLTVSGNTDDSSLFTMSRSSPGRYATHEFGKNVYNVKAIDKSGKALPVWQPQTDVYLVKGRHDEIKLTYTLFANYADGTYADIDPSAVLLNIPATFMWVKNKELLPIELSFHLPGNPSWTIATQMYPGRNKNTFTAPNLQYFMDCPVLMGDLKWRQWEVKNPDGKTYTIRLAFNGGTTDAALDLFTEKLKRVVQEEQAIYQELPAFDNGVYTFLADINPYVHQGDGMEHRNSTVITDQANFDGSNAFLGTFAHEFFHCWNVERIRPASLEPFDFAQSNISEGLWFAEGFTQYYGNLSLVRAGFQSIQQFEANLKKWVDAKSSAPGGRFYSPMESSRRAVFADAGNKNERNNQANNYISYYSYGGAIALALDLELRSRLGKSLDGFMQKTWERFGKTGIPYTMEGLQDVLSGYTNPAFASEFFEKYIYDHQPFDYQSRLAKAGFALVPVEEGNTWIGNLKLVQNGSGLELRSSAIIGTPAYQAGVDFGDVLTRLGKQELRSISDLQQVLHDQQPGDPLELWYIHRGEQKKTTITPIANPEISVVHTGVASSPAQEEILQFRNAWLGAKWP